MNKLSSASKVISNHTYHIQTTQLKHESKPYDTFKVKNYHGPHFLGVISYK